MRQRITTSIIILFLMFLHLTGRINSWVIFFLSPFLFLLMLYFSILEDKITTVLIFVYFLLFVVIASLQTSTVTFLFEIMIVLLGAAAVLFHQKNWKRSIHEISEKKKAVAGETDLLRRRHEARIESLDHLEERVDGLVHLFEAARDLNECLDFSDMLSVLDQKIASEFNFERGTVILLEPASGKLEKQISRTLMFGPQKRTETEISDKFAQKCVALFAISNQTIRIEPTTDEEKSHLKGLEVAFPLWLFPLSVERQLIAILAIEGASSTDFQKFEILASQLALQVKKVKLYETVKETSIIDGLTQVFVRRHFMERFGEELKRAFRYKFPLSVLMVDVDHFKSYNDKFGHLVGDKTLREVAQIIRDNIRRVDVLGRYGGEEFIIVAPEIEKKQALELAERIRAAVASKRFRLYDEETQVTVSIGVSSFPLDLKERELSEYSESSLMNLIQKADLALYEAKTRGRDQIVAYSKILESTS